MIYLLFVLLLIGGFLIFRGWFGTREGTTPYCRKCGYNLTGLTEPRCPECGTQFTEATILRGTRRRNWRKLVLGAFCLAIVAALATAHFRGHLKQWQWTWQYYQPNFMVLSDLSSPDQARKSRAAHALLLRIQSGYLSDRKMAAAADPLIDIVGVECRKPRDGTWRRRRSIDAVTELLYAGVLSERQIQTFFRHLGRPRFEYHEASRFEYNEAFSLIAPEFHYNPRIPAAEGILPHRQIMLLSVDGQPQRERPVLSDSIEKVPWYPPIMLKTLGVEDTITVRITTIWYDFGRRPPRQVIAKTPRGHNVCSYKEAIARLKPRKLCTVSEDFRFDRSNKWQAVILTECNSASTIPSP